MGRISTNPTIRAAALAFFLGLIPPLKRLFVAPKIPGTFGPPLGSVAAAVEILGSAQVSSRDTFIPIGLPEDMVVFLNRARVTVGFLAQVPISMLMLSGSGTIRYLQNKNKEEGAEASFNFSSRATFCIIFGRVLLMPVIGEKGQLLLLSRAYNRMLIHITMFLVPWLLGIIWWKMLIAGGMKNPPEMDLILLLEAAVPTAQNIVMLVLVHSHTPEHGQALAYVILWQYALAIPVLIISVAVFLTMVRGVHPI